MPRTKAPTAHRRTTECEACGEIHERCTGHRSDGKACGRGPMAGQTVCYTHGGNAPQSKEAAKRRILEAMDPVAARLVKIALKAADERVALKAIDSVLDRGGLGRYAGIELSGPDGEPVPVAVKAADLAAQLEAFQAGARAQREVSEAEAR